MVKFQEKVQEKVQGYWRQVRGLGQTKMPEVIEVTAERLVDEPEVRAPFGSFFAKLRRTKPQAEGSPDLVINELEERVEENLEGQDKTRIAEVFHRFVQRVKPEDLETIKARLGEMQRGPIKEVWQKVQSLAQMARDPNVAWKSKAVAIAALLYLISPLDAIPDVIPFVGLADDVAVIVAVVSTLAIELEKYVTRQAEKTAEIEIKKHTQKVRITLLGSIAAAAIAIIVKLILNALS